MTSLMQIIFQLYHTISGASNVIFLKVKKWKMNKTLVHFPLFNKPSHKYLSSQDIERIFLIEKFLVPRDLIFQKHFLLREFLIGFLLFSYFMQNGLFDTVSLSGNLKFFVKVICIIFRRVFTQIFCTDRNFYLSFFCNVAPQQSNAQPQCHYVGCVLCMSLPGTLFWF